MVGLLTGGFLVVVFASLLMARLGGRLVALLVDLVFLQLARADAAIEIKEMRLVPVRRVLQKV